MDVDLWNLREVERQKINIDLEIVVQMLLGNLGWADLSPHANAEPLTYF